MREPEICHLCERLSVLRFLLPVCSPSPFPELFPKPGASGVLPSSGPPPRRVGRQGQCSPERPNRKFRGKLRCIKKLKNLFEQNQLEGGSVPNGKEKHSPDRGGWGAKALRGGMEAKKGNECAGLGILPRGLFVTGCLSSI